MEDLIGKEKVGLGCGVIIFLFIILVIFGSFRTIKAGEVGVKTRFGKVVGTQLNEGLNFKLPLIEKITKITIKVKKFQADGSGASKDLQDVKITVAVNYKVNKDKATDIFRNIGTTYEDTVLAPAIQESIKSISSSYTAEELITSRQEVSSNMQNKLKYKVKKYGLIIDSFNIVNFSFSDAFNQAIEEKQVAEQKVQTAKNALEKSKIESEQKVVEAKASAEANKLMQVTLTDAVLRQRFIEKWNGILPVVNGGSNILDISSLIK